MTEAQAKQRLAEARRKAARFRRLRNLWRVQVRRRLHRLRRIRADQPHVNGNVVEGGTLAQRLAYLFRVAPPIFRLYYSESPPWWITRWAVHNVSRDEGRSDCSAWPQNVARCVQAASALLEKVKIAGPTFYTGWVVENCPQVDRRYAETHIGTAVVYGAGAGFHMGLSLAEGPRTIEHGTPSLDYGTFDEFGAGTEVRFYQFLT